MAVYFFEFVQNYISKQKLEDKTFTSLVAGVTFEQQVAVSPTKFSLPAVIEY